MVTLYLVRVMATAIVTTSTISVTSSTVVGASRAGNLDVGGKS
jgi:hypothetical protein